VREWSVHADGAEIRSPGRAAALVDCARKADAALLAAARVNLKNPPRVYTEIAIEQLPDIVSFFEHDVPLAFADAQDAALKAEFAQTNTAVIASLKELSKLAEDGSAGEVKWRLPHRCGCVFKEAPIRRDGGPAAGQDT
jgi:hypothetical protein